MWYNATWGSCRTEFGRCIRALSIDELRYLIPRRTWSICIDFSWSKLRHNNSVIFCFSESFSAVSTSPRCAYKIKNPPFRRIFYLLCHQISLIFNFIGEPPLVCSPLCKALLCKFTPRGALVAMRCFDLCGGRPTLRALDPRSLFEKSDAKTFKF